MKQNPPLRRSWAVFVVFHVLACTGNTTENRLPPPADFTPSEMTEAPRSVATCDRRPVAPGEGVHVLEDIEYAPPRGFERRLDLAFPAGDGPHPLVALFHAGGWANGSEDQLSGAVARLARHGYAAATVRYRLANRAPLGGAPQRFPAATADARCALRMLRQLGRRHGIDATRVVTLGFSAGGHLATLLAVAPDGAGLDDGTCPHGDAPLPRVVGAVSYYGVYDLTRSSLVGPTCQRIIDNFMGGASARDRRFASPMFQIRRSQPPLLLVHGQLDDVVRVESAVAFHAALQRSGAASRLLVLPGVGHGLPFLQPSSRHQAVDCTVLAFLRDRLRPHLPSGRH